MSKKLRPSAKPQSLIEAKKSPVEERLIALEASVKKQQWWTIIIAFFAAILGGGGVIGAVKMVFDQPLQKLEQEKKQFEILRLGYEASIIQHKESAESLQRMMSHTNDPKALIQLNEIMVQQEKDFHDFMMSSQRTLQRMLNFNQKNLIGWQAEVRIYYNQYMNAAKEFEGKSKKRAGKLMELSKDVSR